MGRRVAIVGSREYPAGWEVSQYVRCQLPDDAVVISGGAYGVDSWAAQEARKRGLEVLEILPDWDKHGKAAGFIRNAEIVAQADEVVAFWDGKSRGTRDTIVRARLAGKPVRIFMPDED